MKNANSRRQFLKRSTHCAGAVVASHLGAMWLSQIAHATATTGSPTDFKMQFARALKSDNSLTPFAGVSADLSCDNLVIEGKLPPLLKGRFYRNGPALFERGDQRYQHWFAGDGMVQQFNFSGNSVSHRGRFVQTSKFKKEEFAGKFLLPAFGSAIKPSERITGPDSMNVANTNAIEHAGKVLALWEGGSAFELDRDTLETKGPIAWQSGWEQMPFSAHPKRDPQGNLWNIGSARNTMLTYHIDAKGRLAKAQTAKLNFDPRRTGGMIHDMAVTERFIVVPIPPVVIHWDQIEKGKTGRDVLTTTPNEPLRVWIGRKDDISQAKIFELPSEMIFHVGNAYERGDEIILTYVGAVANDFLGGTAVEIMRGEFSPARESVLKVARFNWSSNQVKSERMSTRGVEFPRIHPALIGAENRYLLTTASWKNTSADHRSIQFDGIELFDTQSGKTQRYEYGQDFMPEEHIFVAQSLATPTTHTELESWIIGTAFDKKSGRSCVSIFEAGNLNAGPVARAWLPYGLPLGFHGNFHGDFNG